MMMYLFIYLFFWLLFTCLSTLYVSSVKAEVRGLENASVVIIFLITGIMNIFWPILVLIEILGFVWRKVV